MSTAAPPARANTKSDRVPGPSAAETLIEQRIAEASRALWWAELTRNSLRLVLALIAGVLAWVVVDQWIYSPGAPMRLFAFALGLGGIAWFARARLLPLLGSSIRPEYAARSLEKDLPELRQSLTSYVTLQGESRSAGLRSRVVRSMGAVTAGKLRKHDALPVEATGTMSWWVATVVGLAVMLGYAIFSPKNTWTSAKRLAAPLAQIDPPRRVSIKDVQPGDVDAIAGRTVDVSAEITGLRDDEEVFCRFELPSMSREVVLTRDEDRRHQAAFELPHSANGPVPYVITAGDAVAGPFRLRLQDVPVVALQSVRYVPPEYTGRQPYVTSRGAITALEGTRVTISATTNRAVSKARIDFNPRQVGDSIQATAGALEMKIDAKGTALAVTFPLRSGRGRSGSVELESYRIEVTDDAGQSNPEPIVYPIQVMTDLPPEVSITLPLQSPQDVPINAQQIIEVHASDPDYGLQTLGLEIRKGVDVVANPALWRDANGAKGNRVVEYPFRPLKHDLRVGDTVQVVAIAADNRRIDGQPGLEPNRTQTDAVELRIVAAGELPPEGDPNAAGLSTPDDPSAKDPPSDQQGDQGQGGGGSDGSGRQQQGDSQQGDEGSSQGQSGGSQSSEGDSGGGQSGGGQSGESQSGGGQQQGTANGDGDSGQNENPDRQQNEGQQNDGQQNDGQQNEGQRSQGQQGGDPQGGQQDTGQQANDQADRPEGEAAGGQQADSQQADGGQSQGDASGSGSDGQQQTGGRQSDGQGDSQQSDRRGGAGESGSASETGGDSESQSPPEHDGETFERIRDYLEQKQQRAGESGDQNEGSRSNNPDTESRSQSNRPQSEGERPAESRNDASTSQADSGDSSSAQSDPSQSDPSQSESSQDTAEGGDEDANEGADRTQGNGDGQQTADGAADREAGPQSGQGDRSEQEQSGRPERSQPDSDGQPGQQDDSGQQDSPSDESSATDQASGEAGERQEGDASSESSADRSGSSMPSNTRSQPQGDTASRSQASGGGASDSDAAEDLEASGQPDDTGLAPEPPDLEYAKKATDLVLDYLNETRDAPDQDLLDKLKWTEGDLKRFADRWQKVRDLSPSGEMDPDANRDIADALQSLGLRAPEQAGDASREAADSLRGIQDTGNRRPPPAAFRDAFDAFRRAMGRNP